MPISPERAESRPHPSDERGAILAFARANRRGAGEHITAAEFRRLQIEAELAGLRLVLRREFAARSALGPDQLDRVHDAVDEIVGRS